MAEEVSVHVGADLLAVPGADCAGKTWRADGCGKPFAPWDLPGKEDPLSDLEAGKEKDDPLSDPGVPLYY